MTFGRALALAIAVAAGSAVTAGAQNLPWPTNAPPAQPQQAPWPASAPAAPPMAAPAGPMMGGPPPMMGGPPPAPTAAQQACLEQFTGYRTEVEKRAMAAKAGSEKKVPREEMCKLVSAYSNAEASWVKFSVDNMAKCGIPKQAVDQIKGVHVHTADIRKKICEAGPAGGGAPAAPSLSDALGTTRLPTHEAEKTKSGGALDTLTGNALTR
jgi:hypothetical protein